MPPRCFSPYYYCSLMYSPLSPCYSRKTRRKSKQTATAPCIIQYLRGGVESAVLLLLQLLLRRQNERGTRYTKPVRDLLPTAFPKISIPKRDHATLNTSLDIQPLYPSHPAGLPQPFPGTRWLQNIAHNLCTQRTRRPCCVTPRQ